MAFNPSPLICVLLLSAAVSNEAVLLDAYSSSAESLSQEDATISTNSDDRNTGHGFLTEASIKAMSSTFERSEKVHQASMEAITAAMTVPKAMALLRERNLTTPALVELMSTKKANLRVQPTTTAAPVTHGADTIRDMMNDMIYVSMKKYDEEIATCTSYYADQCLQMSIGRGKVSGANSRAANARALMLDSQAQINKCEEDIPTTKLELKQHKLKCKHEITKLRNRVKLLADDLVQMDKILAIVDKMCPNTNFVQLITDPAPPVNLLEDASADLQTCTDMCTGEVFIRTPNNEDIPVKSQEALSLLHEDFEIAAMPPAGSFLELRSNSTVTPVIKKTVFNNPPLPKTEVPANPCTDPHSGKPDMANIKRSLKCVPNPKQCERMKENFLKTEGGIQDEHDTKKEALNAMEKSCKETETVLDNQITNDEDLLANSQTKLAQAMTKQNDAAEEARTVAHETNGQAEELKKKMKSCSANYLQFEGELCALKMIRAEVFKLKVSGKAAFFQDCTVGPWTEEECSVTCGGGDQDVFRSIQASPNDGAKCLPLKMIQKCNMFPCPVDCKVGEWEGWSKCSADCGGGITQRLRPLNQAQRFGGKACGPLSETRACNNQACEKDCSLTEWTAWSSCSKKCDGGTQKRQKFIKSAPTGEGKCPDQWSLKRLEYKECNMNRCVVTSANPIIKCQTKLDVVLLLDGSGSLGTKGWLAELKAADAFISAFIDSGSEAQMSVILYSGPFFWSGVRACFAGPQSGAAASSHMEKVCKTQIVTHMSSDLAAVRNTVKGLVNKYPRGSTLTSVALIAAKNELSLGRSDAKSVVVAITDGKPLSGRRTWVAARSVRKVARLVWVAVTQYNPLAELKQMATRRWQENLVYIKNFDDLANKKDENANKIVANICPQNTR